MTELQHFVEKLQQQFRVIPEQEPYDGLEAVLKGRVVELYLKDGDRLFIVADEEDARLLGESRGAIYTAAEVRRVIQVGDPVAVAEIHDFKREFDGKVSDYRKAD